MDGSFPARKGEDSVTTRDSMDSFLNECASVMTMAEEQWESSARQEHYEDEAYSEAMQNLESILFRLEKMQDSANSQQREQLNRARIRLLEQQNKMILQDQSLLL